VLYAARSIGLGRVALAHRAHQLDLAGVGVRDRVQTFFLHLDHAPVCDRRHG